MSTYQTIHDEALRKGRGYQQWATSERRALEASASNGRAECGKLTRIGSLLLRGVHSPFGRIEARKVAGTGKPC
jgi:hypothetical protein